MKALIIFISIFVAGFSLLLCFGSSDTVINEFIKKRTDKTEEERQMIREKASKQRVFFIILFWLGVSGFVAGLFVG